MSQALAEPQVRRRRWTSSGPLAALRDDVEEFASSLWSDLGEMLPASRLIPCLDLSESDTAIEVKIDLPGFNAKDIEGAMQMVRGTARSMGMEVE